jgi:hypothetical protein
MKLSGAQEPGLPAVRVLGRGPLGRLLRELRGDLRRPPGVSQLGGLGQRVCELLVRPVARQGQVPGPLLGVDHPLGQLRVQTSPLPARRGRIHRGCEQRMGELDPAVAANQHHPVLLSRRQLAGIDERDRRLGQRTDRKQRLPRRTRQAMKAACGKRAGRRAPEAAHPAAGALRR